MPGMIQTQSQSQNKSVADLVLQVCPLLGAMDEIRGSDGVPRPAWQTYLDQFRKMGPLELGTRWEEAKRILRDNGVSYNVYADPRGGDRPWQLDAIPQVLGEAEWKDLSRAVVQRARTLEALLADVYGPQRVLAEGVLPESLVHANPGYLRPMQGVAPAGGQFLHMYGCELARSPDGTWLVLADRTQAPAGAGYLLENRIVLSRTFPEAYRACKVRRLAPDFLLLRQNLSRIAKRENPRAVLLTPGPFNETYFEHAYLARYLGYTLAEGGDLTVRDERVYLKTLAGLRQVDVILRRMDDDFCDPLELRGDSSLGIPGLVQAVRAGNVVVANSLGSGMAEGAALLPYVPELSRFLLGEEPVLRSVPSWWCGDPAGLAETLRNMGELVVKPSFPALRAEPVFGDRLGEQGRQILADRIRQAPDAWCAQSLVPLSSTVEWSGSHPRPRTMALRVFVFRGPDGWTVVPGALVRTSAEPGRASISMQSTGGTKDMWVLSDQEVAGVTLLREGGRADGFRRGGIDIPSRVADNLYWLGRYAERAEGIARLSRAALSHVSGEAGPSDHREVGTLMNLLRQLGILPAAPPTGRAGVEGAEHELVASIMLPSRAGGLQQTLHSLHQAGFQVRDRISNDTWRVLNLLGRELSISRRAVSSTVGEIISLLDHILLHLSALSGMSAENTTRGHGWRFLDIGHRLERTQFTVELALAALDGSRSERPALEGILETADVAITYRSRYLSSPELPQVLDLLLADETNPRSLLYQLLSLQDHLDQLPALSESPHPRRDQRIVLERLGMLRLLDWPAFAGDPEGEATTQLREFLEATLDDVPRLSEALSGAWLSHSETINPLRRQI